MEKRTEEAFKLLKESLVEAWAEERDHAYIESITGGRPHSMLAYMFHPNQNVVDQADAGDQEMGELDRPTQEELYLRSSQSR